MNRKLGRPRTEALGEALMSAAEELLIEEGFSALTINAVVERAGTSRPAFYRRYSGVPQLLLDLLRDKYGATLHVDTGSLRSDLLEVQRDQAAMFNDPLVRRALAGFLDALGSDEELSRTFTHDFFLPRRTATKDVIGRAVYRGEIPVPKDLDWICDLLTAPMTMRATFPGIDGIGDDVIQGTVRVVLQELGAKQ